MRLLYIALGVFLFFARVSFASGATIECELIQNDRQSRTETIEMNHLTDCYFIRPGTVCDFVEGKDQFWSFNFDPGVVASALVGDTIAGTYLEGYVFKTWEVTSETPVICILK